MLYEILFWIDMINLVFLFHFPDAGMQGLRMRYPLGYLGDWAIRGISPFGRNDNYFFCVIYKESRINEISLGILG